MTILSYTKLFEALVREGLEVVKVPGSRARCRCHTGSHQAGGAKARTWSDTLGVMTHLTAGGLNGRSVQKYIDDIINGDPDLPFKSQLVTAPNGIVYLNGAGRANHAGGIGIKAYKASVSGNWRTSSDFDDRRGSQVDGNAHFIGNENIAAKKITQAQYDSSVLIASAVARATKRDGNVSVGHGECSSARGFADPNLDMGKFRRDVMAQRKRKP